MDRQLKRKATQHDLNTRRPKSASEEPSAEPFRFLDLPTELRDIIYGMVAEERTAYLRKAVLIDHSNLLSVSRQVREEYLPIIAVHAAVIKTKVYDFDFRNLVTFVNRLSAMELNALPKIDQPSARYINVELQIVPKPHPQDFVPDLALLKRWLKRTGHPTKKGAMLDFTYTLHKPPFPNATATDQEQRAYGSWFMHMRRWHVKLEHFIVECDNERVLQEAIKIDVAFEPA